jgi:hypothetical protein
MYISYDTARGAVFFIYHEPRASASVLRPGNLTTASGSHGGGLARFPLLCAGLTLDREVFRLRDTLAARFADLCYNGFWFSPEMDFILHAVRKSQERVTGAVDIQLYKGKASISARSSPFSLYSKVRDSHSGCRPYDRIP